jgi:hypothetical protein
MSDEIQVEEDRLSRWSITIVIVVGLVIMAFSIWLAWALLVAEEEAIFGGDPPRDPMPAPPAQVARTRQTLIGRDREGLELRQEQRDQLSRYEWVDRDEGVVRIPIERAIELRAGGMR